MPTVLPTSVVPWLGIGSTPVGCDRIPSLASPSLKLTLKVAWAARSTYVRHKHIFYIDHFRFPLMNANVDSHHLWSFQVGKGSHWFPLQAEDVFSTVSPVRILASKDLAAGVPKAKWHQAWLSADSTGHPAMMRAASNLSLSGQWAPKSVTVALKMEIVLLDDQNIKGHKGQALHGSFQIWPIPRSVPACCLPGKPRMNEPGYLFHKAQLGLDLKLGFCIYLYFPCALKAPPYFELNFLRSFSSTLLR